jgi:hypothetical protein
MNRRIWLSLLSTLLLLTGVPASADTINMQSLLSAGACTTAPDPNTPGAEFGFPAGCWTLQNRNSDGTVGGAASGTALTGSGGITVTGSDANLVDSFGTPISTLTQFTTVISDTTPGVTMAPDGISLSGDLTFNWLFTTEDAGSFYDPAGYFLCSATPTGYPSNICGLYQLTSDLDALNPPDPLNPPFSPFAESGTVTVTLAPGDVFGAYVLTQDNMGGAGTITFSDQMVPSPEPASFLLIGGGFMGLGWAGRKARRRQAEKAARN